MLQQLAVRLSHSYRSPSFHIMRGFPIVLQCLFASWVGGAFALNDGVTGVTLPVRHFFITHCYLRTRFDGRQLMSNTISRPRFALSTLVRMSR